LLEYLRVLEGSLQHKIAEISIVHKRNWIDDITGFLTPLKVTISWRYHRFYQCKNGCALKLNPTIFAVNPRLLNTVIYL
jgi:hypothetical protein